MFCREIFGKKPKKLDFGLQPHRIPDSETVRNHFVVHFMKNKKGNFCPIWVKCCILRFSVGVVPDALLQRPLCSVSSCSGQSAFLHQAERAPRSAEGGCEAPGGRRSELLVWCRLGQRYKQTVYDCPPDVHNYELYLTALSSFCLTEDAKRMAIKEEQYDPGYEVAFGGAYGESAPEGGQSNGYCNFSTSEEKGWHHLSSVEHIWRDLFVHTLKVKGVFRCFKSILCLYLQLTLRRRRLRIQTRLARFRTVSGWCSLLPIRSQTSATPLKPKAGVYEEGPFWGTSDDVCRFLCSSRDAVPLIFSQSNPEVFGALVSFSCALLWQVCYVIISGPIWGVTVSC